MGQTTCSRRCRCWSRRWGGSTGGTRTWRTRSTGLAATTRAGPSGCRSTAPPPLTPPLCPSTRRRHRLRRRRHLAAAASHAAAHFPLSAGPTPPSPSTLPSPPSPPPPSPLRRPTGAAPDSSMLMVSHSHGARDFAQVGKLWASSLPLTPSHAPSVPPLPRSAPSLPPTHACLYSRRRSCTSSARCARGRLLLSKNRSLIPPPVRRASLSGVRGRRLLLALAARRPARQGAEISAGSRLDLG